MKNYIFIFITILSFSCTKDISSYNDVTKSATTAPPPTLFSNAVRGLADGLTSANVNTNVFRFTVQHWAGTTYQDEPNYDFTTRNIPQAWFTRMYRDVLVDLEESKRLIPSDITISDLTKTNQIAIADIMQVYTYAVLVNTFGNVPYTEALDFNNLFPKYDDAKTIYDDLLKRLEADIAALNPAGNGFSKNADVIYGTVAGEADRVKAWIKFGNSLMVRMAMIIADVDAAKAKALVEKADAGAFSSAADNAIFKYQPTTPNTNPIWVDLVQSGRQDFVICDTIMKKMQALNDPRISLFFKPNAAGVYIGGKTGSNNTYADFAKPNDKIIDPAFPSLLLDYTEIEFYRAEAIERGFAIAGTAEAHYNNAITASIKGWGGSAADADAYLANPEVAFTSAKGEYKEKIGTQKWIALFNRGFEGWTEVRRLDFPALKNPPTAKSGFPNRFTYPTNEQTLNGQNYKAAAAAIGGDKVETKLFWDKY